MRAIALLVGTSLLAACGGSEQGISSGGSVAVGGGTGGSSGGGSGGGSGSGIIPGSGHTFENPTEQKSYIAVGGTHSFQYNTQIDLTNNTGSGQQDQLYAGNATTVRNSGITVDYNPRDAIFDLVIADANSGVNANIRFQDPAHRTDFGGRIEPQRSTPDLSAPGIQYLEVTTGTSNEALAAGRLGITPAEENGGGSFDQSTFFYQQPGTTTRHVTFAGYLRNSITARRIDTEGDATNAPVSSLTNTYDLSRGVFVFGEATPTGNVPGRGTGTYSGSMLATSVVNDQLDNFGTDAPTYFQWIEGSSDLAVDFGANTFSLDLTGTAFAPEIDLGTSGSHSVRSGATFNANGRGNINLVAAGGFVGQFQQAWFVNPDNSRLDLLVAGSSIDGAFYGPSAEEAAGNFRIVGGTPDERIDILGVFTGAE